MFDKSNVNFPSKNESIFLAHCSISPVYSGAEKSMISFVEKMSRSGIAALPEFFPLMNEFRQNVGKLLKTSSANISYVHNTAEALCMIANGYPFSPGDQIISYIHEYPSNHYPWVLQKKRDVELVLLSDAVTSEEYQDIQKPRGWSMEELASKVTDQTRVVAISHVQFTSGYAADLEELGAFCQERNIDLIVDCAQSLGCLPVYPEKYKISAVAASCWKWLLGPMGSGLLFTSEEFRDKIGQTMAGPGTMMQGLNYLDHSWSPHRDGRKFEYSTLPWDHVAAMNTVVKEVFLKYPMEEIRDEVFRLQDLLLAELDREKLKILIFGAKNRSGIIAAEPIRDCREIVNELGKKGVVISAPVGYLRFAPHFYNDDKQIVDALAKVNCVL